jgi:MerR family transcriptional regulator, copper efflux regulator
MRQRGARISHGFGIGELSRSSGVAVPNIRYYEEIGILPKAGRGPGGQRNYGVDDLKRLAFVRNCRTLGYPLEQVRSLVHLANAQNRTCDEARELALQQLALVRQKRDELRRLELELRRQVAQCDATCLNGPAPCCSIIKTLAETADGGADLVGGEGIEPPASSV